MADQPTLIGQAVAGLIGLAGLAFIIYKVIQAIAVFVNAVEGRPEDENEGEEEVNPLLGTWTANIEQSRRHANHQFQSATLTVGVSGDVVSLTHAGVNMAGKSESGTTVLTADGQERPVSPEAPGVVAVTKWVGLHKLVTEAKKDGRVVGSATYAVSDDRTTLTATVQGIDAAGKAFDQVIVFERTN